MTQWICNLMAVVLLPLFVFSQNLTWTEDYGSIGSDVLPLEDHDFDWLYEKLFPESLRAGAPAESFKSIRVHLQDTHKKFPDPLMIVKKNLNTRRIIAGAITYAGFVKKAYTYDVLRLESGEMQLQVRVYLKDARNSDWGMFSQKVQYAEDVWNRGRVAANFPYSFRFEIVKDSSLAHFSVGVMNSTRGPYDTFWGRDWTGITVAHQLGHMLGLGDEYQTVSGKIDCYQPSLMCSSWTGSPMFHHYYFILRRLLQ